MSKKNKEQIVYRNALIERAEIDETERLVSLSFSSEEPVVRFDMRNGEYLEVLGHREGEIDMSFIGSGRAPLLQDHDPNRQVGVVKAVEVSDGRARALVKVSRSAAGTELWQDVLDGIRTNVSVGYYILEQKEEGKRDGMKVVRATKWRPIEISSVSIPADESVGVGRSQETTQEETTEEVVEEIANNPLEEITMSENNKVEGLDLDAIRKEAAASEQARVREIVGLGSKFNLGKAADEFVKNNRSADEFRAFVLENVSTAAPAVKAEKSDASIGMSDKEVRQYSVVRAIRAQMDPKFAKDAGFELEVSRAAAEKSGQETRGIVVPYDVLTRDLLVSGANDGSKMVATDLLAGSFIDLLRNNMVVAGLGATMLTGLRGNVAIPRQTGAATAYWIATEGNAITSESTQTLDQVALTPKTLGAYTDYSRQLVLQSSMDVEAFVRNDLAKVLAIAIDKAALYGSAGSGEPRGIANVVGIGNPTDFAAAVPTFAEVVALESEVAVDNALMGNLAYLTDPVTRGGLKTKSVDTGSGRFVWEGEQVNGYRAVASSQVTAGDVFFGNWADLLLGMWGGLDITVDPYALSTAGGIRVVALQSVDVAVRHPQSFALNNDGA